MPFAPAQSAAPIVAGELALRARENLARNAAALGRELSLPPLHFCLARDGSLSAYDAGWLGGISVPRRGGEVMLRNLTVDGNVACLVLPVHAQQIVACLAKLERHVAVIALLGGEALLAPTLACHDFSAEISAGRLMLAWDEPSLAAVFADRPGLPIPQQFVRLATSTPEQADPVMAMAKSVFAPVVQRHADRIRRVISQAVHTGGPLCVVGSGAFRLWDDATDTLARVAGGEFIDTDVAAQSASAHVAERAAVSRAIVTADTGRADRAELAPLKQPWLAWITQPRVPPYLPASPRDGLLLADECFAPLAAAAGWPADRVRVATFPLDPLPPAAAAPDGPLVILADLPPLAPPDVVNDFSSWRVAWDAVAAELQSDPLRLGPDAEGYLDRVLRQYQIDDKRLPRELFLSQLIAPAFTIGIAKLLKARGLPAAVYGDGWDDFGDLDPRGPITDRAALRRVVAGAGGVVDCSLAPRPALHAINRPVIRAAGLALPSLLASVRSPSTTPFRLPRLTADAIQTLLD